LTEFGALAGVPWLTQAPFCLELARFLLRSIGKTQACLRGATMPDQTHFEIVDTEGYRGSNNFPDCKCGQIFEIAAVNMSVFHKTEILWTCPGCGLEHAEVRSKARKQIRDRIATLDRKLSILTRRALQLRDAILHRSVQIEPRSVRKQRQP
jgi:hypothetical protein